MAHVKLVVTLVVFVIGDVVVGVDVVVVVGVVVVVVLGVVIVVCVIIVVAERVLAQPSRRQVRPTTGDGLILRRVHQHVQRACCPRCHVQCQ